jgi:hypothetical protein
MTRSARHLIDMHCLSHAQAKLIESKRKDRERRKTKLIEKKEE